ncbi:MAG: desulfoferrodoxin [Schwartzia sp.]|nr:desulfoferrodoxin [Schwartzia sp. (in: firmicutes)]
MDQKFFICKTCGNIIAMVKESGVPVECCGEPMQELVPGTVDASREKHVPVYEVEGCKVCVQVGAEEHPMAENHYIEWISLQTNKGIQCKHLCPGEKPCASFCICEDEQVEAVYAYCNLHGLWKK